MGGQLFQLKALKQFDFENVSIKLYSGGGGVRFTIFLLSRLKTLLFDETLIVVRFRWYIGCPMVAILLRNILHSV